MSHANATKVSVITPKVIQRVRHDLRAPAVNIRGFVSEIDTAVEELVSLMGEHSAQLPGEFVQGVSNLIANDLKPCLRFLEKTSHQFDSCIDDVTMIMSEASSEAQ